MRVLGLTGGIGSGKSTLAALLADRGLPVVDADALARDCVAPGTPGLRAVASRFGSSVLAPDGSLDRGALAAVVFADAAARADLEAIVHPCVRSALAARLAGLAAQPDPPQWAVVEHPLLVESGMRATVNRIVVVEAAVDLRLRRLVARGMVAADARSRMASQASDEERRAVADLVVSNDGDELDLAVAADRVVAALGAWV